MPQKIKSKRKAKTNSISIAFCFYKNFDYELEN
jgi:hypothetical protein